MALIRCPDCGKEVSSRAKVCIHCGCPLTETPASGIVKIKLPRTEQIAGRGWIGLLSPKAVTITAGTTQLWRGKHGETATFSVEEPTPIAIDLGIWGNRVEGTVYPHKRYALVKDYGIHMRATFRLTEVDVIDAE